MEFLQSEDHRHLIFAFDHVRLRGKVSACRIWAKEITAKELWCDYLHAKRAKVSTPHIEHVYVEGTIEFLRPNYKEALPRDL